MKYLSIVDAVFLRNFMNQLESFSIDDISSNLDILRSLYKFLKKKSRIILINQKQIDLIDLTYNFEHSLLRYFLELYHQGDKNIELISIEDSSNIISKNEMNFPAFLFYDGVKTYNYSKFGIKAISCNDVLKEWNQFKGAKTFSIPKVGDESESVNEIFVIDRKSPFKRLNHKCNAIIITDNYLMNFQPAIKSNLFKILGSLISGTISSWPVHLTILTSKFFNRKDTKEEVSIEEAYEFISDYLEFNLKIEYFDFTLIKTNLSDYHDRQIYTNYYVIKSGNSFNYFHYNGNSVLKSSTTIDLQPWTGENGELYFGETYEKNLREIKNIIQNSTDFFGSKNNRLLNYL